MLDNAKAKLGCVICVLYTNLATAEMPQKIWNMKYANEYRFLNTVRVKKHPQDITPTFQESSSV